ncbi:MAG TPA: response regulator [Verrucomicrobiae bacterium]|nr:response regulator [Verrucomicrobiae bacterium]
MPAQELELKNTVEEPDRAADQAAEPAAGRRILVVEDDAIFRRFNIAILAAAGYQVDGAADGVAGWEALQLQNYDLLVTDNGMPRMTGLELVKRVHESHPQLPVIMATGSPPVLDFAKEYELKPVILIKPYTSGSLVTAVTNALGPGGE